MNKPARKSQLLGVQALRGLAALLVVVGHLLEHGLGDSAPPSLVLGARFGVIIFFVISGFVIHHASGDGPIAAGSFALRRVMRVVPLYWGTTLLVAAFGILAPQVFKTTTFSLTALVKSLLFIPYESPFGSGDWRPLFKLGWTLNYEMMFYTVMLCLFWCRTARLRAIGLTVVMGALMIRLQFPRDPHAVITFYANYSLAPFLAGVWIAEAWRADVFARLGGRLAVVAVPLAIGLILWLYAMPASVAADGRTWPLVMTGPAVALMIVALSLEREGRDVPFLQWIGDISYSIYLLHMFIVGLVWAVAHKLHPAGPGMVGLVAIVAAGLAVTLAVSHASFRWFETPINRLGSRLARRLSPQS